MLCFPQAVYDAVLLSTVLTLDRGFFNHSAFSSVDCAAIGKADGTYVNGAVVIRDGVLVVPKGAVIPPGTVV